MDALRGYVTAVKFPVPSDLATAQFKVYRNDVQVGATSNATIANSVATATLPYSATLSEGPLRVDLSFTYQAVSSTLSQTVNVVTPLLEKWEVLAILPNATDADYMSLESGVRYVIQAHCGQSFGYSEKTITVEGHGETALRLPERLIEITGFSTLTNNLDPKAAIIVSDGWYLKKSWAESESTITSDSAYWGDYDGTIFDNGIYSDPDGDGESPFVGPLGSRPGRVIVAPGTSGRATPWANDYPFNITGKWGYLSVPQSVKEAAKLLANDYACMEVRYRDSYLESIKAADWRLQFSSRAWESTGNARADQLLDEFVLLDWAVV
jgi:hypothetical protein